MIVAVHENESDGYNIDGGGDDGDDYDGNDTHRNIIPVSFSRHPEVVHVGSSETFLTLFQEFCCQDDIPARYVGVNSYCSDGGGHDQNSDYNVMG